MIKRRESGKILIIIAILVFLTVMMAGFFLYLNSDSVQLRRQLDLGQKYLEEQNYEQAIVAFDKAIGIDPMRVDAYLGLAEAYEKMGDYDMALETLQKGYDRTGDERILEVIETLELTLEENSQMNLSEVQETEKREIEEQEIITNIEFNEADWGDSAIITAYSEDGDIVWKYETPQYEPAELSSVSEIGQKNDKYYFVQGGDVVALDIQTGDIIWENSDFGGGGGSSALGENAIYLCGYYGPDFYAVSYDGDTLTHIEHFTPDSGWAYEIKILDGKAAVYCDLPENMVFYVDLETYQAGTESYMNGDESWKGAYVQFINEQEALYDAFTGERMEYYKLVDINNDDIPELYIDFRSFAGGAVICTYSGNSLKSQHMSSYGFSYIEGQNLFLDTGGHMDAYHDTIYSIIDGTFVEQCHGYYGAEDNSNVQIDADGEPVYTYSWNDIPVTKEEYEKQRNSFYDEQQSISPFDDVVYDENNHMINKNGLCNYQEIMEAIVSY